MDTGFTRRQFIRSTTAGGAALSIPMLNGACRSTGGLADASPPATAPAAAGSGAGPTLESSFPVDEASLRKVLAELGQRGANRADAYFQRTRSNSINYEDGIISKASTKIDRGVGLRAVVDDQVGYAFTEDLSQASMLQAARSAATIAHGGKAVPPQALQAKPTAQHYSLSTEWSQVAVERKLPVIQRLAEIVKASDPSIVKVSVYWNDAEEEILIADLQGRLIRDFRPMTRLWVNVTATKNGQTQSNGANIAARQGIDWYTEERLQALAKQAIDRTMILFEARRPPAGELPVVLAAGASGILLHEAIGHGMEADFNRKNTSIYADMLGKQIAPEFVTIVDDGKIDHERGALNVDDEGVETQRTVLVERGILASYLHDEISAKHYGIQSTGSGRRQSFRHKPLPRMRCTFMENGPHGRDEVIGAVQHGIIAETFTNGQVQIGAGDFTFYIKNGWLIEGGKVTAPIKDVNIIGNGPEVLRRVTMAANDSKLDTGGWTCGKDGQGVPVSQGLPTVLVSRMTVGGRNA